MNHPLRLSVAFLLTLAGVAAGMGTSLPAGDFPERLRDTGLYAEHGADGTWRFAAYVWDDSGREAVLAPSRGVTLTGVPGTPRGRYAVPSRGDCMVCHGSAPVPVVGFTALQLSPDRDPHAAGARPPHAGEADLHSLATGGLLRNLPSTLAVTPPRIPATTPLERAALGMLHGNCAHCHNRSANRVPLPLTLAQGVADPVAAGLGQSGERYRGLEARGNSRTRDTVPVRTAIGILDGGMWNENRRAMHRRDADDANPQWNFRADP